MIELNTLPEIDSFTMNVGKYFSAQRLTVSVIYTRSVAENGLARGADLGEMIKSVKDLVVNSNSTSRHRLIFAVIVAVSVVATVGRSYLVDHVMAGSNYIRHVIAKTRLSVGFGYFSTLKNINNISKI